MLPAGRTSDGDVKIRSYQPSKFPLPIEPPIKYQQETGRKMPEVGQMAPDFTLPAHNGEPITLSDFKGKKNVVLSFHIFSFTGG